MSRRLPDFDRATSLQEQRAGFGHPPSGGGKNTPFGGCYRREIPVLLNWKRSFWTNGSSVRMDAPFIKKGGKSSTGRKTCGLLARICVCLQVMEKSYDRSA
jgi:hypothetical protein